jgi:hypothetical protein
MGSPVRSMPAIAERIGARYEVRELIGRGGMALVYRVIDTSTGKALALKQLAVGPEQKHARESAALFEREFHTLAQLSHPQIIAVYDYGIADGAPFYTMELLDEGDLRERSPLSWQRACVLLYDVCSSLALIHSRRMVHRDISPRNIRCTASGQAKLIDFGAMVPMGHGAIVVGTPPFVAPEVVYRSALDARTDLFSLGATFYYVLTGRPAYPARDFSQLLDVWKHKPYPPSALVDDIPPALDALVMSMLSLDAAMRPRSAFDVMQRLTAIAGIEPNEALGVSRAYLATPQMVGREAAMAALRRQLQRAFSARGRGVVIAGGAGCGRSRMLDALVLEAKTLGATVLRAAADTTRQVHFAVTQTLAEQFVDTLPDVALHCARKLGVAGLLFEDENVVLPDFGGSMPPRERPQLKDLTAFVGPHLQIQTALSRWLLLASESQPLVIAVDDAHRIDEPSAALLAALSSQARKHSLLVAVTHDSDTQTGQSAALDVLDGTSAKIVLEALTREQTAALITSVFGDVPYIGVVSEGIHRISGGNPRLCMDLAQHLVDQGSVRYAGGSWQLPAALGAADLPRSATDALRQRIAALSALARWLLEAQALASHAAFVRDDYLKLCQSAEVALLDEALSELLARQLLVGDGRVYRLAQGLASAFTAHLSESELRERHQALGVLYGRTWSAVHHLLAGGESAAGLDLLAELFKTLGDGIATFAALQINTADLAVLFERALEAALSLGRPKREVTELRQWIVSVSVVADEGFYHRNAPAWLEQLKHDSGLSLWEQMPEVSDAGERLTRALTTAFERYNATPEAERGYRPDEAIRLLVAYVVNSIAVGSRCLDVSLLDSLPGLLAPFVALSPLISAIHDNALAVCETRCLGQPDRARARWMDVNERLAAIKGAEERFVGLIRSAIVAGIATVEAYLGLASATTWVELLDQDEFQRVNALYLGKVVRLQQGDWDGAERYRRQAELVALQARTRPMFATSLLVELNAHTMASDLTGIKHVIDRIESMAARLPGWAAPRALAEGRFQHIRGNFEAARRAFERCLDMTRPDAADKSRLTSIWPAAIAGYLETLIALGRYQDARVTGERALARCNELEMHLLGQEIARALAMAEAKLGDYAGAAARLEEIAQAQTRLGASGLPLGATYEARARIAIWARDQAAVEQYARLCAQEYRYGRGSALGARYERLMDEARRTVDCALPELSDFVPTGLTTGFGGRGMPSTVVTQALRGITDARVRAERGLALLCDECAITGGHLFLFGPFGLDHVASYGVAQAPEGLPAFLREYVARQLDDDDCATAIVTDAKQESLASSTQFTEPSGLVHHPVLLTCLVDGARRHAGVAVLVRSANDDVPPRARLMASALASYLIQEGDTLGARDSYSRSPA